MGGAPSAPAASVVITTHRTPQPLLDASVASVLRQTLETIELVVVVDLEHDADLEAARSARKTGQLALF